MYRGHSQRKGFKTLIISLFFPHHLEKMAQFLFPGWLIISYVFAVKKEGIDVPGWENDFLVKIIAGKSP